MRRFSTIAFVGMLALITSGCSSGNEVSTPPTPSTPQVVKKKPGVKPLSKLVKPTQQPSNTQIASAFGLIQPTNAQDRIKQLAKGRIDPFSLLPGQVVATVPTTPTIQKVVPKPPTQISLVRVKRNVGNAGSQFRPGRGNLLPPVVSVPFVPTAPQPDLAKGVTVTGVVQVGTQTQAIVKVPNEATSRYVREGQRLSNGRVLVKRIEMNQGPEPVVILEQYGTEVNKVVGEVPANAQTGKSTGATTSNPQSGNTSSSDDR